MPQYETTGSASPLVRGREVGVPVHQPPLTVEAPVDVRHPDRHLLLGATVHAGWPALEADLERLKSPGDLDRWLALAGLGPGDHASGEDLAAATALREAIHALVLLDPADRVPAAARLVNEAAAAPPRPRRSPASPATPSTC